MIKDNVISILSYIYSILKLFAFIAFSSGLLFGVFQAISENSISGFKDGIMFGIILTLITAPVLILLDIIQKVKCYVKYKFVSFSVKQERSFSIEGDYENIFSSLYTILNENKIIKVLNSDLGKGSIEAITKRSWKSFGEKIDLKLFKTPNNRVVINLSSKPRIFLTLIDYCKNFENVETIKKRIGLIVSNQGERL